MHALSGGVISKIVISSPLEKMKTNVKIIIHVSVPNFMIPYPYWANDQKSKLIATRM